MVSLWGGKITKKWLKYVLFFSKKWLDVGNSVIF